jgi:predicted neuraminidase
MHLVLLLSDLVKVPASILHTQVVSASVCSFLTMQGIIEQINDFITLSIMVPLIEK